MNHRAIEHLRLAVESFGQSGAHEEDTKLALIRYNLNLD
jgi:hypothetical protein